jgi:hypothetical protein
MGWWAAHRICTPVGARARKRCCLKHTSFTAVQQATDSTFSAKLRSNLMKNPHFGYDKRSTGGDFLIDHFAGDVVYSCTKFLDKNRDTLSPGAASTAAAAVLLRLLETAALLRPTFALCSSRAVSELEHIHRSQTSC